MIVLNLIFLEVQFECDFLIKKLVKIPVYPVYIFSLLGDSVIYATHNDRDIYVSYLKFSDSELNISKYLKNKSKLSGPIIRT